MDAGFQFDVFLSHSAKDKPTMRPLAERLRQDGLKVWSKAQPRTAFDRLRLPDIQELRDAFRAALLTTRHC